MRSVAVVTGTRAEYGLLKPVIEAIRRREMEVHILAAGMHLSRKHGYTVDEILKDGFSVAGRVEMGGDGDGVGEMAVGLGRGIIGVTQILERLRPSFVLVLGDRSEALAGAISGAYLNMVVAHIHGGEVSKGCIDESIRHAITKFSHLHFAATEESAERIRRLGEKPRHVFVVGAPGLDAIASLPPVSRSQVLGKFHLREGSPVLMVVQHPVTQQAGEAGDQMRTTLDAVKEIDGQVVLIYPNNDAGSDAMISVIEGGDLGADVHIYRNLDHSDYLELMRVASVIVGNSSSALIEAPSFRLAAVNVGIRQKGRLRAANVIDVPHDKEAILKAIRKALFDEGFREGLLKIRNPYGDGRASVRIAEVLHDVEIDEDLCQKQITY